MIIIPFNKHRSIFNELKYINEHTDHSEMLQIINIFNQTVKMIIQLFVAFKEVIDQFKDIELQYQKSYVKVTELNEQLKTTTDMLKIQVQLGPAQK